MVAFPFLHDNDADIDSAANAAAYATLALGLNIVVGFAGLLDLGYAAFFAIGAYSYGVLTAYQLAPPWSSFWEPFQYLHLVEQIAGDQGVSTAQLAVAWALSRGDDIIPLIGTKRRDRLTEALHALDLTLSTDDLAGIEAAVPAEAVAGDRYEAAQVAMLDSER